VPANFHYKRRKAIAGKKRIKKSWNSVLEKDAIGLAEHFHKEINKLNMK
jgi:hypothetical protein